MESSSELSGLIQVPFSMMLTLMCSLVLMTRLKVNKRTFHQNCGCFKNYFFYDMFFQQRNLHAVIKITKL